MDKKESFYKILGATANIGNAKIKEKYIQALKKHPPETGPEGIEKVKEDYETLKDPQKRKQYDPMRKYGANVDDLFEKASQASESGNIEKAEKLLERANTISPENPYIVLGLMSIAIEQEDFEKMDDLFKGILEIVPESETGERATLYTIKAAMLAGADFYEAALETLEEARELLPQEQKTFAPLLAKMYLESKRFEEAWEAVNKSIPKIEDGEFEDIYLLILWSKMMFLSERWKDKSKVQSYFREFIKNITDEQEKDIAHDLLIEAFDEFNDHGNYREAEFYIDLITILDKNDPEINEKSNKVKELARVQKDLDHLEDDDDIFPLVYIQAFEWFYEGIIPAEKIEMMVNSLPSDILDELKEEKELHAAGIIHLRKKYPKTYKYFKEGWDELFEELTEGLNREMKRELRRKR